MKGEKTKVRIIYHHKIGCIVYQKGDMVVGAILSNYDDVVRVIDFKNGLLTILMKKTTKMWKNMLISIGRWQLYIWRSSLRNTLMGSL